MAVAFPQRVVALQPSVTATLHALGMLERLVACTRYCLDVCPEAAGRAIVEDSWTADAGEIIAAQPDLVIAAVPYQQSAITEILRAGMRVLLLAPRRLGDVYGDIALIAATMGVAERGEEVIGNMRDEISAVARQMRTLPRVRVFCEEWGKPVIASQPWVAELIEAAGGQSLGEPGKQITADEVAALDPDVLVLAWCGAGDRVPLEKMIQQRSWQKLRAVGAGRVFCIRDDYLNTPALTLLNGLRALAWALHPENRAKPPGIRQMEPLSALKSGV